MAKLSTLKPALGTLKPSVAYMPQGERERDQARATLPWRAWYNTMRWRKLAASIKLRDLYTCQRAECGRVGGALVADHRKPHRGNPVLFWDERNLWTLCKACHDGAKQREERRHPG